MQQYFVVNGNNSSQMQLFNGNSIQPMVNVQSSLTLLSVPSLQIIPSMSSSIQSKQQYLNPYTQNGSYMVLVPSSTPATTPNQNQININNNTLNCMNSANINFNQQFNINQQYISFEDLQKQLQQISCSNKPKNKPIIPPNNIKITVPSNNNNNNINAFASNINKPDEFENTERAKTELALLHTNSTSPSTASSNSDYSIITNNINNNCNKPKTNIKRGKYSYQCIYCKRTFKQSHSLKDHTRIHTGERPYQCSYCRRTFKVKYNMVVHTRIHTGVKPYSCGGCGKRYASKSGLNAHCKKHHPIQNPK